MFLNLAIIMIDGIYLLLGTNLGDKKLQLMNAKSAIRTHIGSIIKESAIYETAAWGKEDQPSFLNQVIEVRSALTPNDMLLQIEKIEKELGRVRLEKWGERLIDIDILYYSNQVIKTNILTIPHPGIPERRFTLRPLSELAPNFKHPVLKQTNNQLLQNCTDRLDVTIVKA